MLTILEQIVWEAVIIVVTLIIGLLINPDMRRLLGLPTKKTNNTGRKEIPVKKTTFSPFQALIIIFIAVLILVLISPFYIGDKLHQIIFYTLFAGLVIYVLVKTKFPPGSGSRRSPPPAI